MRQTQRRATLWVALCGTVLATAVIIPLLVAAGSGQPAFTATLYSDVIRFEADGVASLRVTIYDLSENELWNSGLIMGDFVDWDRANKRGERLANGYYLYLAQSWDAAETLVLNKTGKVVLLPGNQVELKAAPVVSGSVPDSTPWRESPIQLGPMAVDVNHSTESWAFQQVGIGTTDPTDLMHIYSASWNPNIRLETDRTSGNGYAVFHAVTPDSSMFFGSYLDTYTTVPAYAGKTVIQAEGGNFAFSAYQPNHDIEFYAGGRTSSQLRMFVDGSSGNIGIGTTSPNEQLEITGNFRLPATTATTGIIYAGGHRFIHNYGNSNTFIGIVAGNFTTTGVGNTAAGEGALNGITTGYYNTAVGRNALYDNTTGDSNTAVGWMALANNTTGRNNTVVGDYALINQTGGRKNTAVGQNVLPNLTSGDSNVALGHLAGQNLTSGSHNVYISNANTPTSESNTIRIGDSNQTRTYIAGIHGVAIATTTPVYVDIFGQLGTVVASSRRFKTAVADIGQTSSLLYELRPVSFRYTQELGRGALIHYGLIAEEVAEVAPDLVINDEEGAPHGVRYEQLVPLLLNELQELRASNDALLARLEALEQEVCK